VKLTVCSLLWLWLGAGTFEALPVASSQQLDVTSYYLFLEPSIEQGTVVGKEIIEFQLLTPSSKVTFDAGSLEIDSVLGAQVLGFEKINRQLRVQLVEDPELNQRVTIFYHGSPASGMFFNPELGQAHTVYATSQWMICNDAPHDKAQFRLDLLIPNDKQCISNGELEKITPKQDKTLYSWRQQYQAPAYTYGLVIGDFNSFEESSGRIVFKYWSSMHNTVELKTIFNATPDMLRFFEEKSGVPYYQTVYSQVLIGNHYQEMSGFSVLKDTYGPLILEDSSVINLISHELSHQWWGNQITCRNWNHFWLNEAFATFMSAAYNEHRFGKQKYLADIDSYFQVYQKIRDQGKDRSLVFESWSNPTSTDRNLVYFKGAYVLHLLRQELGDEAFWQGVLAYSSHYFGKSVVTKDFQQAMEASSGKSLADFFDQWVY
jgi:aminopeptidase N